MVVRKNHSKSAVSEILRSAHLAAPTTLHSKSPKYGGWESSTRCNFRKHMQIEKAPANQENIFISLTTHMLQMLTTQTNKEMRCKCLQHNQIKNFICSTFLCLVVLWVFAVRFFICLCCEHLQRVLSNWSCFFNLQVFFLFAVHFFVWLCCEYLQCVSLFGCVVRICSACVVKLMKLFFFIRRCFFYLFVLWAFAARMLSNWWSCFLNLQAFFLFAARWALSATVPKLPFFPILMLDLNFSRLSWPCLHAQMHRVAAMRLTD